MTLKIVTGYLAATLIQLAMAFGAPFNPATDTPLGVVAPGQDITAALQWAVDHQHEFQQQIVVPGGNWLLSDTVTMPYRIGGSLLGSGITHPPIISESQRGAATVFCWVGEAGKPMIVYTGEGGEIGNFTLIGKKHIQSTSPTAGIGLLVDRPAGARGIGTGTLHVRRLWVEFCDYGVQMAATRKTSNCDNVVFELLRAHHCKAAYRSMGEQVVDITIQHFVGYNVEHCFLIENGGGLSVQRAMTGPGVKSFLRLPNGWPFPGTGKYNGHLRFSNVKVDARAGKEFCYVDSDNPLQLQIVFNGEMYGEESAAGVQAKLCGANWLVFENHASTFKRFVGTKTQSHDGKDLVPAVTLRDCRLWGTPTTEGDIQLQVTGCYNGRNEPYPDIPAPPEPDLSGLKFQGVIE